MKYVESVFHPPLPATGLSLQQQISPIWLAQLIRGFANSIVVALVPGVLCKQTLERTFGALVEKHPALRTRYVGHSGEYRATIGSALPPPVMIEEAEAGPPLENAHDLLGGLAPWAYEDLDLSRDCQLDYRVLQVRGEYGLVVMRMPHFISDGYSKRLLFFDFCSHYDQGGQDDFGQSEASYDAYVRGQGDALRNGSWDQEIASWQALYEAWPKFAVPPSQGPCPPGRIEAFLLFELDEAALRELATIANQASCSAEFAINVILAIGLAKWAGSDKILFPLVARGRSTVEDHEIIGLFALNVLLPVDCCRATFGDVLREAFATWVRLSENGGLPGAIGMVQAGLSAGEVLQTNVMIDLSRSNVMEQGRIRNVPFNVRPENSDYEEGMYLIAAGTSAGVQSLVYYATGLLNSQGAGALGKILTDLVAGVIAAGGDFELGSMESVSSIDAA